ncbi:disulfide bond formation protein B [Moraxella canis]|uniref:disulfide bond formation protein B n=1 Tax=Moraxella canis TaxID=90239 RepID=UPI0006685AF4|nr:disulfide bond formation protein B [Moraxella canis]
MNTLSYRLLNLILSLMMMVGSVYAIGYLQNHLMLDPCPLCIFQRIGLWVMGLFALLAAIINPRQKAVRLILWLGSMAGTLWGLGVAARHTWIHYVPSAEPPACGPGLEYWVQTMPMSEVLTTVLRGNGDCGLIDWTFMGLSIPAQALILFTVIALIQLVILKKILNNHR